MALEAEDRTEDLLEGKPKPVFEAKQSIAQMPRKLPGVCRMVVEFYFYIEPDELKRLGQENGTHYVDGVDYLRAVLKWLKAENLRPWLEEADRRAERVSFEAAK